MAWVPIIAAGSRRRRGCCRGSGSGIIVLIILIVVGILSFLFFSGRINIMATPLFLIIAGIGFVVIVGVLIATMSATVRRNSEERSYYQNQSQRQPIIKSRLLNPYTQNSTNYEQPQVPSYQEYDSSRYNKQSAKYCSYCGEKTTLDAAFCPKCGSRLIK